MFCETRFRRRFRRRFRHIEKNENIAKKFMRFFLKSNN